jgi:hypothetical protein
VLPAWAEYHDSVSESKGYEPKAKKLEDWPYFWRWLVQYWMWGAMKGMLETTRGVLGMTRGSPDKKSLNRND